MTADVLVVGSGIVGAAVALRLAVTGRRVTVVDDIRPAGSATGASGAMLGVLGELVPADPPADLALRLDAWARHPSWWDEIGMPPPASGTFVVAGQGRDHDLAALEAMEGAAAEHGLPAERVEAADAAEVAPAPGARPERVLYLAGEAWVDGPALRTAVLDAAARHGATLTPGPVARVTHEGGRCTGAVLRGGDVIRAAEVVLCAGASVPALVQASGLGAQLLPPVVPAKGTGLLLDRGGSGDGRNAARYRHVVRTPNRQFACGLHVVPRGERLVYVGSTNRPGGRLPGTAGKVTAGEAAQLIAGVTAELASPLSEWDIAGLVHGRRPLPLDGMPVAGRTELDGLSAATGTYRNGVLLAPLMADVVCADLDGKGLPELSPRRPPPVVDTTSLVRRGLGELVRHWRHDGGAGWHDRLAALVDALAWLAFDDDPAADEQRRRTTHFLRDNGRAELVPEAVMELAGREVAGRSMENPIIGGCHGR